MAFTPRPPKEVKQREFTEVQFVYGKDWTWKIPNYFLVSEIARIRQVPYTHAHNFLVAQLNSPTPINGVQREPSMIMSKQEEAAELVLRTFAEQKKTTKILPDDKMIASVLDRFLNNIGENEQSYEVSKEQLDLICTPKDGAPKLSTVFDIADRGLMQDAINFFYTNPDGMTNDKEEQPLPVSDSGNEEKISETTTEEVST
jgi:hypothetical protein